MRHHFFRIVLLLNAVLLVSLLVVLKRNPADHLGFHSQYRHPQEHANDIDLQELERWRKGTQVNTCQVCRNQTACDEIG
jgi:hypothetical protein